MIAGVNVSACLRGSDAKSRGPIEQLRDLRLAAKRWINEESRSVKTKKKEPVVTREPSRNLPKSSYTDWSAGIKWDRSTGIRTGL